MTKGQKLALRASEIRQKLNELAGLDELTEEQRAEVDTLTTEYRDVETRARAAIVAEDEETRTEGAAQTPPVDAEERERLELRSKARVTRFLQAALSGRVLGGAEAEYSAAENAHGDIPIALFEEDVEERAPTSQPDTVGVNMAAIQPAIFAPSIAAYMGIDMPMVESGTYGQARIKSSLRARSRTKGQDETAQAATFDVKTATPKRVSGALEFLAEDVAGAGVDNFESALRENLSMVMSAELDNQIINGDGSGSDLEGLFHGIGDPTADATLLTFAHGIQKLAALVDGLWAKTVGQVRQVVGVQTYRLAAQLVTSAATGEVTLAEYLSRVSGGFRTNARMPAVVSKKQQALAFRSGVSGVRTAVAPHWGRIGITDIYTGAGMAQTRAVFHVLLGNVMVIQPDAYRQVEFTVQS